MAFRYSIIARKPKRFGDDTEYIIVDRGEHQTMRYVSATATAQSLGRGVDTFQRTTLSLGALFPDVAGTALSDKGDDRGDAWDRVVYDLQDLNDRPQTTSAQKRDNRRAEKLLTKIWNEQVKEKE